jgi:hypothetical protein
VAWQGFLISERRISVSNIPKARDQIRLVIGYLRKARRHTEAAELERILHQYMLRDPPIRKAPVTSRRVSPGLKAAIRADAAANPGDPLDEIAARHGVNPGRVSEILNGKR